jgi:energy-coupling factor transporter ATP-binding protein EcfA2
VKLLKGLKKLLKARMEIEDVMDPVSPKAELFVTPKLTSHMMEFIELYELSKGKPIIIIGNTGVGKSLFTEMFTKLFNEEYKKEKKIKTINCSFYGGDVNLIRSELFGHEKGAFTGAIVTKDGALADKKLGAVIFEEIGDLPPETQAQLLRFIETGEYYKVGGSKIETTAVQIVGATNREYQLRDDFLYRFEPFYIPSLYQRRLDILFYIAIKFPEIFKELSPWETLSLLAYNWPGNVRELERVIRIIQRLKKTFFWLLKNQYRDFASSFLFELDTKYTELHGEQILILISELKEWQVDINFLEKYLNTYFLGLIPDPSRIKYFLKDVLLSKFEVVHTDDFFNYNIQERIIPLPLYDESLSRIYLGITKFCSLFYKDVNQNDNLLIIKDGNYTFNTQYSSEPKDDFENKNSDKISILRRKIIAYLSGIRNVADNCNYDINSIDFYVHMANNFPDNPFFTSISGKPLKKEKPVQKDISVMTRDEILKAYYGQILKEAGGNLSIVAEIAGRPRSTTVSELKRLNLLEGKRKNNKDG